METERVITNLSGREKLQTHRLEKDFLVKDALTQEDINAQVDAVGKQLESVFSDKAHLRDNMWLVLDFLRDDHLVQVLGPDFAKDLPEEDRKFFTAVLHRIKTGNAKPENINDPVREREMAEYEAVIRQATNRIRRGVVERMKSYLSPSEFAVMKSMLSDPVAQEQSRVERMRAKAKDRGENPDDIKPKVQRIKPTIYSVTSGAQENRVVRETNRHWPSRMRDTLAEALTVLEQAGSHPNVIPIKRFHREGRHVEVGEVKLRTAENLLRELQSAEGPEKQKLGLQILKVIRDCIRGAMFFGEKGLVLQDLKLDNFGVNNDPASAHYGEGIIFDLDGLAKEGAETVPIYTKGYEPPKALDKVGPVTGPEMNHQFGRALQILVEKTKLNFMQKPFNKASLASMAASLADTVIEDKLSLAEAEGWLTQIIDDEEKTMALSNDVEEVEADDVVDIHDESTGATELKAA